MATHRRSNCIGHIPKLPGMSYIKLNKLIYISKGYTPEAQRVYISKLFNFNN